MLAVGTDCSVGKMYTALALERDMKAAGMNATFRATGLVDGFMGLWMSSWASSWLVAFPTVLVVAPLTRRLVARFTKA